VYLGIYTPLKSDALGLATSVAAIGNVTWLLWVLHRKLGKLGMRSLLVSTTKTIVATMVMAGAIIGAQLALDAGWQRWLPRAVFSGGLVVLVGRIVVLVGTIVAGLAAFFITARLLQCRELVELRRRPAKQNAPGNQA